MKSSVEKTNTSAKFTIEFDQKDFEPARLKALEILARDIKISGFRQGKAPANVVEKHIDPNQLASQTLDIMIRETIPKIFSEEDLTPISTPHVDVMKFVPGETAEITISADIMPEVEFCDYAKLEADFVKQKIGEADVEEVLSRIAESFGESSVVKRAAQDGDEVIIDFTGTKDGVAFEGGTAKDFKLKLGSKQFIPGFEDGIIGHEVGDKFDLNISFPEDYGNAELAGQPVVFEILLKQVNEFKSAPIDDELAKKTGAFETLEALREDILKNLEEQSERQATEAYKDALLAKLVDGSKTEAPETLLQDQIENFRSEFLRNLKTRGLELEGWLESQDKTKDDWENELKEAAERRVISSIIVQKLGEKLEIVIGDEELEAQLEQLRSAYAKSAEALKDIEKPETQANIRNRMRINAIMEKLVSLNKPNAKIVEKSKDDLVSTPEKSEKSSKTSKKTDKKSDKKAAKAEKKADKKAKKAKK